VGGVIRRLHPSVLVTHLHLPALVSTCTHLLFTPAPVLAVAHTRPPALALVVARAHPSARHCPQLFVLLVREIGGRGGGGGGSGGRGRGRRVVVVVVVAFVLVPTYAVGRSCQLAVPSS
jgi:hypothetical protein